MIALHPHGLSTVAAAATPRLVSTEYPRGSRAAAANLLQQEPQRGLKGKLTVTNPENARPPYADLAAITASSPISKLRIVVSAWMILSRPKRPMRNEL